MKRVFGFAMLAVFGVMSASAVAAPPAAQMSNKGQVSRNARESAKPQANKPSSQSAGKVNTSAVGKVKGSPKLSTDVVKQTGSTGPVAKPKSNLDVVAKKGQKVTDVLGKNKGTLDPKLPIDPVGPKKPPKKQIDPKLPVDPVGPKKPPKSPFDPKLPIDPVGPKKPPKGPFDPKLPIDPVGPKKPPKEDPKTPPKDPTPAPPADPKTPDPKTPDPKTPDPMGPKDDHHHHSFPWWQFIPSYNAPVYYNTPTYVPSFPGVVYSQPVVVTAPAAPVSLTRLVPGSDVTVSASLGFATGRAALQVGEIVLPVEVLRWQADGATLRLPAMSLAQPTQAELVLIEADGSLGARVACELNAG